MIRGRTKKDLCALLLSGIFSPPLVAAAAILGIAWYYADGYRDALRWGAIGLGLMVVPSCIYILIAFYFKKISAIDLNKREDRLAPVAIALLGAIFGIFLLTRYEFVPDGLRILEYSLLGELGIIMLVTIFWKISIHMMTLSAVATLLVLFYSQWSFTLYLCLIPVGWARLHRKRHTPAQLLAGTTVGVAIVLIVMAIMR